RGARAQPEMTLELPPGVVVVHVPERRRRVLLIDDDVDVLVEEGQVGASAVGQRHLQGSRCRHRLRLRLGCHEHADDRQARGPPPHRHRLHDDPFTMTLCLPTSLAISRCRGTTMNATAAAGLQRSALSAIHVLTITYKQMSTTTHPVE